MSAITSIQTRTSIHTSEPKTNSNVVPRSFLIVLWDGGGSVPPQLATARRLVARGHDVRVLGPSVLRERIEASGASYIPYRCAPEHDSRVPERDLFRDWEARTPLGMVGLLRDRVMVGPALAFARDVLEEIARRPVDVIASDYLLLGPLVAAESAGVPSAALFHQIYTLPTPGVPIVGTGFMPARGPLGRLRDAFFRAAYRWLADMGLADFNAVRAHLGLAPLPALLRAYDRVDRALVMTRDVFDFPAAALPANVRYVGEQLADADWEDSWRSPWHEGHPDPLVLVSLSTTFQRQRRVLENLLEALEPLPLRALVTVGPSLRPESFRAPKNTVVRQYVPHVQIMPDVAAVITHAGHGTVITALKHGVPLVCLPMGRDQHDNAARVVLRRAGISVNCHAKPKVLRAAIQRVLDTPAYRAGARSFAERMRDADPGRLVVQELEALAATGAHGREHSTS